MEIDQIVEGSIINQPKQKDLKGTKSWSCNTLIKLFFKVKETMKVKKLPFENIKLLVEAIKSSDQISVNKKDSQIHIEDSGYLTFVDMEKHVD